MKKSQWLSWLLLLSIIVSQSCNSAPEKDNETSGSIKISVDESFRPVMENQIKIFCSRYPKAKIQVEYKSEDACFKDYLEDTTRVIFVTRPLTNEENEYGLSKKFVSQSLPIARDALAIITSKKNTNPQFTARQIKSILNGTDTTLHLQVVFDHSGSSTVRYIQDSLLKGQAMSKNVFAANSSEEVVNYVSQHENALGIIGVSWVADQRDSTVEQFLSKINVAGIMPDTIGAHDYVKPYQAYIGLRNYPYTRNFYFISKESWIGLGTGLVNYLCKDGQIEFQHAKLFPLRVNVFLREVNSN